MLTRGRRRAPDSGFSLVEVLVSVTMTAMMMGVLASLLTLAARVQTTFDTSRAASTVLQAEVEQAQSMLWDDLMMEPATLTPGNSLCFLGGDELRVSAQTIAPGPDTIIVDGVPVHVSRSVAWFTSGDIVTCANRPNDRSDIKAVTIAVQWNDDGEADTSTSQTCAGGQDNLGNRCRSTTIYLSKARIPVDRTGTATTVPGSPGSVTAAYTEGSNATEENPLGTSTITINWTAPQIDGGSTIVEYQVNAYLNDVPVTAQPKVVSADETTYTWNASEGPLMPNTTYTFKVTAVNLIGEGEPSRAASIVTGAALPLPTPEPTATSTPTGTPTPTP